MLGSACSAFSDCTARCSRREFRPRRLVRFFSPADGANAPSSLPAAPTDPSAPPSPPRASRLRAGAEPLPWLARPSTPWPMPMEVGSVGVAGIVAEDGTGTVADGMWRAVDTATDPGAKVGGTEVVACVFTGGRPMVAGSAGPVTGSPRWAASSRSCCRFARNKATADLGTHSVSSSSFTPTRAPDAVASIRRASASFSACSAALTLAAASMRIASWVFWVAFCRRRVAEFHRFFTAFSLRPGRSLAIFVQLLPHLDCASTRTASSSSVQPPFLRDGSRWLNHRSRHCFPIRPGMRSAISDHLVMPASMQSMMIWSSSFVHGPLTSPGCKTFCQRWRHCTSERWSLR
mmetsp:Transcript_23010/g.66942  ORF Transcript_23010/g.66942 Transcript_23010/m.66942 type:complete len:347 (-) Transcript_23010:850-1890(-)